MPEDETWKVPFCLATRSLLVPCIRGVASGTVEAETRFRWFGKKQEGRKERKAETILLKTLLLKGIKNIVQELDGGAPEKNPSLFVRWGVCCWQELAESRGGKCRRAARKDPARPSLLSEPQHLQR